MKPLFWLVSLNLEMANRTYKCKPAEQSTLSLLAQKQTEAGEALKEITVSMQVCTYDNTVTLMQ